MSKLPFGDLPKNLNQALDLSTLGKPATPPPSVGVVATQQTLVNELIPASMTQPVFMVCWSPRSQQSQDLVTMMGEFQKEDGSWILATLNVDTEAAVAQAFQVQAIPFALAIIQQQPLPLFESLPPREQVRELITKVLEAAAKRGIGTAPQKADGEIEEEKLEPEEAAALDALSKSDYAGARQAYLNWLQRSPGNTLAEIGLAQVELLIRIDGLNPTEIIKRAENNRSDINAQKSAADIEIAMGQHQSAFDRLIAIVKEGTEDNKKEARTHLIELFKLVDPSDPILIQARRSLASALF